MVFDEVTLQEFPQFCCMLLAKIFLLYANAICPLVILSTTISTANVAIAIFVILWFISLWGSKVYLGCFTTIAKNIEEICRYIQVYRNR
jgi:hypothetical protein